MEKLNSIKEILETEKGENVKLTKEIFTKLEKEDLPVDKKTSYNLVIDEKYYLLGEIIEEEKFIIKEIDFDIVPYNNHVCGETYNEHYIFPDKEITELKRMTTKKTNINKETLELLVNLLVNNECEISDYGNLLNFISDFYFDANSNFKDLNNRINEKLTRIRK